MLKATGTRERPIKLGAVESVDPDMPGVWRAVTAAGDVSAAASVVWPEPTRRAMCQPFVLVEGRAEDKDTAVILQG